MEQQKQLITLTEPEVAKLLKCTPAALRRMRREKRGPRFIYVGRLVRYRLVDVEYFLLENSEPAEVIRTKENA